VRPGPVVSSHSRTYRYLPGIQRALADFCFDLGRSETATPTSWLCVIGRELVPLLLNAIPSRRIPMQGCHISKKAAVGAVPEPMAPHADGVPRSDVFALDSLPQEPAWIRGFQSPHCGLSLVVVDFIDFVDFEVDPRMRVDQVHFFDRTLERCPCRYVVVAVGMVCLPRQAHGDETNGRKVQGFELHVHLQTLQGYGFGIIGT